MNKPQQPPREQEVSSPQRVERLERALYESEARYRMIVEASVEGVWTVDAEGVTTFVNQSMADMLGYERHEMLGKGMFAFMDEVAQAEAQLRMARRRQGERERHTFRLRHKNGRDVYTVMASTPLHDAQGTFIGALAMVTDETSRRRDADEQEQRELELVRLDKLMSLTALVGGVIHEINNPNHFITLNVPLLRRAFTDAVSMLDERYQDHPHMTLSGLPYLEMRHELPRMLDQILTGADRIRHIVGELRAYVNNDMPGPLRPVNINDVVASAMTLLEGRVRRGTDRFSQQLGQGLPLILADSRRLVQVVVNLVLNALEAITDRTQSVKVQTATTADRKQVLLIVSDAGPGMTEDVLAKAKAPFFSTKRTTGGAGLGLPVAERILAEARGRLELVSQPGQGTLAKVMLPALEVQTP
ncbi:MAG: PAS domain S-box protein [Deltaproteobacteria bacterium]|nr:PAS domain S-box protein [Deltaproteobacteria bacterium]